MNPAEVVYRYFEKKEVENRRERSMSHYPSGLCAVNKKGDFIGKCRRALFYEMSGFVRTDPIDPVALFKMDMGVMIHEKLGDILNLAGYEGEDEIPIKWQDRALSLPFSGRMDKVVTEDGRMIGIDWKSTYGRGVDFIKKDGPKEDAILQCLVYLTNPKVKIDEIVLSYIARDSGYIYSFSLFLDEKKKLHVKWLNSSGEAIYDWTMTDVRRALKQVEESVATNKAPDRDYKAIMKDGEITSKSDWRCRYCSYAGMCWDPGDEA